nr:PREDICTED: transmembrane protein 132B [Tribolium castaneum]|eukprot:XP_015840223.1 PREDICTED: transmembrane protein 132B [Tribolium castaneum]
MPEFPLDLQVTDTRLSQLKSWRVPDYHPSGVKSRRKKRSYASNWGGSNPPDDLGNVVEKPICRLRYQQSPVDVYAHFMAVDHDSGRISYLINRRTWLRVTDLVLPLLRVSDPRIASLHGRILQGRSMGRTEVQVLSPITGRVIGAKEIRVGNDKVGLSRLLVQVVSGLQLNISPDSSIENGYIAETSVTRKLTAQYQEGLLDIELEFSDGTRTPLRDIADSDYHLVVESLDPEVVAFAPMVASHHPRVIAVGEGNGDLLQVTLLLAEECRTSNRPKMKGAGPLATASASVTVDFTSSDLQHRPDILQNDGGSYGGSKREFQDLQDILKGTPLKDDDSQEPNVQARQYQGGKGVLRQHSPQHMTPLEISMYILLGTFCCAIVVFVVSCVVYASKFKAEEGAIAPGERAAPVAPGSLVVHRKPRETTTNAHDWVWLGRATLDSSNRNSSVANTNGNEMRITANPLNLNYCDPDDCLATSFSNPSHIELPSSSQADINSNRPIDSNTYCKSKSGGSNNEDLQVWNKPTPPPPLPPHGVPLQPKPPQPVEDYRPPVPPHRNIGVTSEATPPRKHHHHHHHRNSKHQDKHHHDYGWAVNGWSKDQEEEDEDLVMTASQEPMRSVFEFDDEPPKEEEKPEEVKLRSKPPKPDEEEVQFVQYPKSPNANGNGELVPV